MGKSHQAGWVSLRGKRWFGYFRQTVLDPETNEERVKKVCVKLALKSKMTKSEARDALRMEVTKQTGQNLAGSRALKTARLLSDGLFATAISCFERGTGDRRRPR